MVYGIACQCTSAWYKLRISAMETFENIMMTYKCPKALDELQPCQSNWYCSGCQQMVHDFRGMAENEILDTFKKNGQELCGIYDAQRLTVLPKTPKWQRWLSAAMITLGISTLYQMVFAQESQLIGKVAIPTVTDTTTNKHMMGAIAIIATTAEFKGGDKALQTYLRKRINYKGTFTGKSITSFTVEADGSVSDIKIISGTEVYLDQKIMNVLSNMPKWYPLLRNGEAIRSEYQLAIDFPQKK